MAIELPKDASGACVRLNTTTMYREDGTQFHVSDLFFEAKPYKWFARNVSECIEVGKLYLTPPDSWKKLEEDLARCIEEGGLCVYYSPSGRCSTCILDRKDPCSCNSIVLEDIEKRIRKLRGES